MEYRAPVIKESVGGKFWTMVVDIVHGVHIGNRVTVIAPLLQISKLGN